MANYSISGLNLLKLKGASVQLVEVNGKSEPCVVLPVRFNDIALTLKEDRTASGAYLRLNAWDARPAFVNACLDKHRDDADYVAPSHTVEVAYSQEFEKRAEEAAYNRIKSEAENAGKPDEELHKLARIAVNDSKRIGGIMTPKKRKEIPASELQAQAATGTGTYTAPEQAVPSADDDLPF